MEFQETQSQFSNSFGLMRLNWINLEKTRIIPLEITDGYECRIKNGRISMKLYPKQNKILVVSDCEIYARLIVESKNEISNLGFKRGKEVLLDYPAQTVPFFLEIITEGRSLNIYLSFLVIHILYWGIYGLKHEGTKKTEDVVSVNDSFPLIGFVGDGITKKYGWESRELVRKEFPNFLKTFSIKEKKKTPLDILSYLQQQFLVERSKRSKVNFGLYYLTFTLDQDEFLYNRLGNVWLFKLKENKKGSIELEKIKFKKEESEENAIPLGSDRFANPSNLDKFSINGIRDILIMTDGGMSEFTESELQAFLIQTTELEWFERRLTEGKSDDDATAVRMRFTEYPSDFVIEELTKFKREEEIKEKKKLNEIALRLEKEKETGDFINLLSFLEEQGERSPRLKNELSTLIEKTNSWNQDLEKIKDTCREYIKQNRTDQTIEFLDKNKRVFPHLETIKNRLKLILNNLNSFENNQDFEKAIEFWDRNCQGEISKWLHESTIFPVKKKHQEIESILRSAMEQAKMYDVDTAIEYLEKNKKEKHYLARGLQTKIEKFKLIKEKKNEFIQKSLSFLFKERIKESIEFLREKINEDPTIPLVREYDQLKKNGKSLSKIAKELIRTMGNSGYHDFLMVLESRLKENPDLECWLMPIKEKFEEKSDEFGKYRSEIDDFIKRCDFNSANMLLKEAIRKNYEFKSLLSKEKDKINKRKEEFTKISQKINTLKNKNKYEKAYNYLNKSIDIKPYFRSNFKDEFIHLEEKVKQMEKGKLQKLQGQLLVQLRQSRFILYSIFFLLIILVLLNTVSFINFAKMRHDSKEIKEYFLERDEAENLYVNISGKKSKVSILSIDIFPEEKRESLSQEDSGLYKKFDDKELFYSYLYDFLMSSAEIYIYNFEENKDPDIRKKIWILLVEASKIWHDTDKKKPFPFQDKEIKNFFLGQKNE